MNGSALPGDWQSLVMASRAARHNAYVPFSKFAVGAALCTTGGEVFTGCNVENSSYGLTICAERVAACSAIAAGKRDFDVMCISLKDSPVPCGACRQFLSEFSADMLILLDDVSRAAAREPECLRLSDLLPRSFRLEP